MKRKKEEPYTKKKYITVMTIGILGFLLAFGFLFAAAILQENGASKVLYYSLGFAFLPIGIIDIIFLLNHLEGLMMYELEAKINRSVKDKLITKEK